MKCTYAVAICDNTGTLNSRRQAQTVPSTTEIAIDTRLTSSVIHRPWKRSGVAPQM